mgnify:CR=1 FL=1
MPAILLVGMLTFAFKIQWVKIKPGTIKVRDNYLTIQEAINNAAIGSTVFVASGTYYENVVVNKTLTLLGENSSTTIIDGNKTGTVVTIETNNVKISGFTIRNSGNATEDRKYPVDCGIKLHVASPVFQNVTIENNMIMNNSVGIYSKYSNNNTFVNNICYNNIGPPFYLTYDPIEGRIIWKESESDIFLLMCNASELLNNQGVIRLYNSTSNKVTNCSQAFLSFSEENTIMQCFDAVSLSSSHFNVITNCSGSVYLKSSNNNRIAYCSSGIRLEESNDNHIKSNRLSEGEPIEESFPYPFRLGSARNFIAENILTNGSIHFGSPSVFSDGNVISGNTLVGGGICVYGSHNFISLNNVSKTEEAIRISAWREGNNTISQNAVTNNTVGISVSASNCKIDGNVFRFNELGMLVGGGNNTITNNTVFNNVFGMYLRSSNSMLRENKMLENKYNFVTLLEPYFSPSYNDVDVSNTINGKPIYYLVSQTNLDVNPSTFPNVGYLGLVNCSNITVRGLTLTNNGEGILISQCTNCTIEGNIIKNNLQAVQAYTNNTFFSNNVISGNYHGITLIGCYNWIVNNTITNNTLRLSPYRWPEAWPWHPISEWISWELLYYLGGIYLGYANNNTIVNNNITKNEHGIYLFASSFNIFKNNSMEYNVYNFGIDPTVLVPPEWTTKPPESPQISPYLINDVDTSNTVNGKPIYWWINRHDEQVPKDAGYVVLVNSTNMIVNGLVLQNNTQGMLLADVNNTVVSNNTVMSSQYGILMKPTLYTAVSLNNTITHNTITKSGVGIESFITNSTFSYNILSYNLGGIYDDGEGHNLIIGNNITENVLPPREEWILGYNPPHMVPIFYFRLPSIGIILESPNNTICCNNIQKNDCGMSVGLETGRGKNNKIYHNNFINNTEHVEKPWRPWMEWPPENIWDDSHPSGGNFWSDYAGVDLYSGLYQNETGSDGIGDTQFSIYWDNKDRYPLMGPFIVLDAGTWNRVTYNVSVVSNSTVSGFYFNPDEGAFIKFNVTGQGGTTGFSRVAIPRQLLWAEDGWNVTVNEEPVSYIIVRNESHTYLYFTYNHTTKTVQVTGTHVIPEFPSGITMPLLMVLSMLAVVFTMRKVPRKSYTFQ